MRGDKAQNLVATGRVVGKDAATGTTLTSDRLEYREGHDVPRAVVLNGHPAVVKAPDRELRGNHLEYTDGGGFEASGDVWADVVLPQGRWKFSCDYADGILPQDGGVPPYVHVVGHVKANGPAGEHLEADLVHFEKRTGKLTLRGSPARLLHGKELSYEGPLLELDVVKDAAGYQVASGKTGEIAKLHVIPKSAAGKNNIASWAIDLKGAAVLRDNVLRIPKGADLEGFDAAGTRVMVVRGAAFEFELENQRPVLVRGSNGVQAETFRNNTRRTRMTAAGFTYKLASNSIDILGPGKLWQGSAKEPTRFSEVEMEVVPDGVKLKYLKKLETKLQ
jgi:hypothetical protein